MREHSPGTCGLSGCLWEASAWVKVALKKETEQILRAESVDESCPLFAIAVNEVTLSEKSS